MLNEDAVPVWMLADSLLALLVTGVLCSVAVLPLALQASTDSQKSVAATTPAATAEESSSSEVLRATKAALAEIQIRLQTVKLQQQTLQAGHDQLQQTADSKDQQLSHLQQASARKDEELRQLRQATLQKDEQLKRLKQTAVVSQQAAQTLQIRLTGMQSSSASEKSVRQELLGLQGNMDKTVFVIDISASMASEFTADFTRANWQSGENAWSNVQRKIRDYLEMLPVGSFRIVCFNHSVYEFPAEAGKWSTDRQAAMKFLGSLTPDGITNTEQALLKAALCRPSSILLFTDGQPTRVTAVKSASGEEEQTCVFDVEQQQRILAMPESGTIKCPVNVIALNDYASQMELASDTSASGRSFLAFLQELAGRSGGAFLGY